MHQEHHKANNINTHGEDDPTGTGYEEGDRIRVSQDSDQCSIRVNTVMNLWVPWKRGNCKQVRGKVVLVLN
jgi:hypothetical protein